jgi:prepilin-type N-terminal cleavage/methylation domain-containing protein
MIKTKNKLVFIRGFTLVELLVVIGVLGVLATGLLIAINPAQQLAKARDSARKSAIKQIRSALERYRLTVGTYPISSPWVYSNTAGWRTFLGSELKTVPTDPTQGKCSSPTVPWSGGSSNCWMFAYRSVNGTTYDLVAHLENTSDADRCEMKKWVYNAAGQSWCPPGLSYSNYIYAPGPNQ